MLRMREWLEVRRLRKRLALHTVRAGGSLRAGWKRSAKSTDA